MGLIEELVIQAAKPGANVGKAMNAHLRHAAWGRVIMWFAVAAVSLYRAMSIGTARARDVTLPDVQLVFAGANGQYAAVGVLQADSPFIVDRDRCVRIIDFHPNRAVIRPHIDQDACHCEENQQAEDRRGHLDVEP